MERYGRIDAVFLNAGVEVGGSLLTGTEDEFDLMFAVNFKGPLWLARAALPHLKASGHGRVINLVSLAGKRVMRAEILGYSASKFAANALTMRSARMGGKMACAPHRSAPVWSTPAWSKTSRQPKARSRSTPMTSPRPSLMR